MDRITPLARWMKSKGLRDAALAEKVGCDRTTITRLRLGSIIPSLPLAGRIVLATGGKLKATDFLPGHEAA